jgi:sugar phosphate permease
MRTLLLIGLVIVALIIGILTVKNMGRDAPEDGQTTAEKMVRTAEDRTDQVKKEMQDMRKRLNDVD